MRLIDADNYKGKVIASHCYSGVNKLISIDDVPTVDVNNLIIAELEKIKAELDDLDRHFDNDYFSGNKESMFKCKEVFEIIDKHISELKGGNNV